MGDHLTGMRDQQFEDREFLPRQVHILARYRNLALYDVSHSLPSSSRPLLLGRPELPESQQVAQPREKFLDSERLGDVIVRATVEHLHLFRFRRPYRQDHHRHGGPAAQLFEDGPAVGIGEA